MYKLNRFGGIVRSSDELFIPEDNSNNDYVDYLAWKEKGNNPTPYQEDSIGLAKVERQKIVDAIVVTTVSGKIFNGDEKSQDRMSRAINALNDGESTVWVLHSNTPATVTKAELREALRLAGAAQTAVWATPYEQQ